MAPLFDSLLGGVEEHRLLWALVVLFVVTLPGIVDPIWSLISKEPVMKVIGRLLSKRKPAKLLYFTVPVGLIFLAIIALTDGDPRERVVGKDFRNERVVLDYRAYDSCTFEDVTFVYAGAPFGLERCSFIGKQNMDIRNQALGNYTKLLLAFGLCKGPDFVLRRDGAEFNITRKGIGTKEQLRKE